MKKRIQILVLILLLAPVPVSFAFEILTAIEVGRGLVSTLIGVLDQIEEYKKRSRERGWLEDNANNRLTRDTLKKTTVDLTIVVSEKKRFLREVKKYQENPSPNNWAKVRERSTSIQVGLKAFRDNLRQEQAVLLATPSGHQIYRELNQILTVKADDVVESFASQPVAALDTAQFGQLVQVLEDEANQLEKINEVLVDYIYATFHP